MEQVLFDRSTNWRISSRRSTSSSSLHDPYLILNRNTNAFPQIPARTSNHSTHLLQEPLHENTFLLISSSLHQLRQASKRSLSKKCLYNRSLYPQIAEHHGILRLVHLTRKRIVRKTNNDLSVACSCWTVVESGWTDRYKQTDGNRVQDNA